MCKEHILKECVENFTKVFGGLDSLKGIQDEMKTDLRAIRESVVGNGQKGLKSVVVGNSTMIKVLWTVVSAVVIAVITGTIMLTFKGA